MTDELLDILRCIVVYNLHCMIYEFMDDINAAFMPRDVNILFRIFNLAVNTWNGLA